MSAAPPLAAIAVGVIVERTRGSNQWTEFLWRPSGVLTGEPAVAPWTAISEDDGRTTFFAGMAEIELHRTEAPNYRENIETGNPQLWIGLRPTGSEPPYELITVTADPAEGEGMTEAGNNLVEPVPMPEAIQALIVAFVNEAKYERVFVKRKRDRANPEALGRRAPIHEGGKK